MEYYSAVKRIELDTYNNVDKCHRCYAESKKLDTKESTLYNFFYMWTTRIYQIDLSWKKKSDWWLPRDDEKMSADEYKRTWVGDRKVLLHDRVQVIQYIRVSKLNS